MPEKGVSPELTQEFLEALVSRILGKQVKVTSPPMEATEPGMRRLFRGEFLGDKANRETGQTFTNSLPEAVRYMGSLGEPGKETRVSAVDVPEEIFGKSNNAMREASGRMGMRDALEANVEPQAGPRAMEGENHAFPMMKNVKEDNMHFLIRKLANRKQQIIPAGLAAAAAKLGMTPEGFYKEDAPEVAQFQKEHPNKAEISNQLEGMAEALPFGLAAGSLPWLGRAMQAAGIAGGAASIGDLIGKSVGFENETNGIPENMAERMRKEGIPYTQHGGAPPTETKAHLQFPEIDIKDAIGLLGGLTSGISLGGEMAWNKLKAMEKVKANAKERVPSLGPQDYSGKTYPQINLKDIKDIGNEPYPSGGNTNSPFKPRVGTQEQVTIPGSKISQAPQNRTYVQPQGMKFKGADLSFTPRKTTQNVDKVGPFGDMSPATQSIPEKVTFQNKEGSQPGVMENILRDLDKDKEGFSKAVEAKRAEEVAGTKPGKSKTAREQLVDLMKEHPVLSTIGGAGGTVLLEEILRYMFGGRR